MISRSLLKQDRPVLAAAMAGRANYLLTGDTDFHPWFGRVILRRRDRLATRRRVRRSFPRQYLALCHMYRVDRKADPIRGNLAKKINRQAGKNAKKKGNDEWLIPA